MWQTLLANPRLTLIDDCLYLYQVHDNNATNNTSSDHIHRRQQAIKKLNSIECELFINNRERLTPTVRKYFKLGMGHEIVDLIQYAIAFNEPVGNINGLMRKYHGYTGRFRCSKRLLVNERLNVNSNSRRMAWLASRVLLPYHFIFHKSDYSDL